MHHGLFRRMERDLTADQPLGAGGKQRRVFHTVCLALIRGVHDGDVAVGIGAKPRPVALERAARRGEVALRLREMLWLYQQPHVHRRQSRLLEPRRAHGEVRTRRPGEVVHVLLKILVRRRAVAVVAKASLGSGGTNDPAFRHADVHVVHAVVGEELCHCMELVTVPAGVFQHAKLRKPLRDEVVVTDPPGAVEGARHLRGPGDADGNRFAGLYGPRQ